MVFIDGHTVLYPQVAGPAQRQSVYQVHAVVVTSATTRVSTPHMLLDPCSRFQLVGTIHLCKHKIYYYFCFTTIYHILIEFNAICYWHLMTYVHIAAFNGVKISLNTRLTFPQIHTLSVSIR